MTAEYRPTKFTVTRLEYRRGWSRRLRFGHKDALIAQATPLYQPGL